MTDETKTLPYRVKDFIDAATLKNDMSYSVSDLSSAMMQQGSLMVHYGVLLSKASRQVDDLKLLLETTEAVVYRAIRDAAIKAGNKLTEAQIEKEIALSTNVLSIKRALTEARQIESLAKTSVEALRHKKDMLVSQGLIAREEIRGDVSINRRNAADEERQALEDRVLRKMQRD